MCNNRRGWSRTAGVAEQMGEAPPELDLIPAGAFLPRPGLLARPSTLGGITPPPGGCLDRLQLLQPLPLLGRYQHHSLVTGAADCDRPSASLYFICGGGQPAGIAALFTGHLASMPR